MVVSIAVICYEAFMQVKLSSNHKAKEKGMMQGSESNWEKVGTAGKEDVLALADFAMVKVKQLAVAIMEKMEKK